MVAGGAAGIVGMAGELGADDRLVAFMQYLRVLVIVLLTPVLVAVAFGGASGGGAAVAEAVLGRRPRLGADGGRGRRRRRGRGALARTGRSAARSDGDRGVVTLAVPGGDSRCRGCCATSRSR